MVSFSIADYISLNLLDLWLLTHKQLEKHGCIINTVATDNLVLKHQAISIHSADKTFLVFRTISYKKYYTYREKHDKLKLLSAKLNQLFKG